MTENEDARDARQLVEVLNLRAHLIASAVDDWVHGNGSLGHVRRLAGETVKRAHRGMWAYDAPRPPCPDDEHHWRDSEVFPECSICAVCYVFRGADGEFPRYEVAT